LRTPLIAAALRLRLAGGALLLALRLTLLPDRLALGLPGRLPLGALCVAIGGSASRPEPVAAQRAVPRREPEPSTVR